MKCQKCGSELRDGAKFCDNCGAAVQLKKQCPKCRKIVDSNAIYCPFCNSSILTPKSDVPVDTKEKKTLLQIIKENSIPILIIFFAVFIIVVFGVAACNNSNSSSYISNTKDKSSKSEYSSNNDYNYYDDSDYTTYEPFTDYYYDYETTEMLTEPPTENNPETENAPIVNNTSANGFWAEGDGDYVAQGLNVSGGYAVLHIENYSDGHFSVITYKNDEYQDLLVNVSDPYSGDVLVEGSGKYELKIEAKGGWKITSRGLAVDDTTSFSGSGDAVTGITTHGGGNWKITNSGSGHFSVVEYSLSIGYLDLLANKTGTYDGVVKAEKGDDIFFKVNSKGNWTIEKQ